MAKTFFYRDGALEAATEVAAGTHRLSFASEFPVMRRDKKNGTYWEVLSHAPGDANLGLLNTQGVVLVNHDDTREVGEVMKGTAKVRADRKTEADIRISDESLEQDILLTRTSGVSVGYERISILREEAPDKEGVKTLVFSWRPYEISILKNAEPADPNVGIGRMKKRICPDCEGDGDCDSCEGSGDDPDTDDGRCEGCGGTKRCGSCRGNGYIKTARVKKPLKLTVEQIARDLTPDDKHAMRLLLDPTPAPGGGGATITVVEADERVKKASELAASNKEASERARVKEINIAAEEYVKNHGSKNKGKAAEDIRKLRDEAIEKGQAPDTFNAAGLRYVVNAEPEEKDIRQFVDEDTLSQFSLVRAIQQAAKNKIAGRQALPDEKSVEGDIIKLYDEKCRKADNGLGYTPEGFVIPPHAQYGNASLTREEMRAEGRRFRNQFGNHRDQLATIFGAGGAVVPTFWLLPVIELLRNKSVLNRVGIRSMAGLTGNVIIPRLEAPTTAYSVSEISALTASQLTLGQIAMTPHRVGSTVNYSKQLLFQSSPDFESLLRDDMMAVLALKKDILGLNGQGAASEPLGIMNTPGIGTVTFSATPTYIKMVLFETIIRALNVMGPLAYVSTSATKGSLKTVAEALTGATTIGGSQNAIWKKGIGGTGEDDGEVNGYQAVDSQQMPFNQVLCGAFQNFIEGIFGGFDVVVDPYTKAANAEIVVTMNLWLDYACRHPQAFAVSTDSGAQ